MNNYLKKESEFEIIENDIFYKEGIIEFLEKNNELDIIIFYEKLEGQIDNIELIRKIKIINEKIEIYFILEKTNNELENLLKKENIMNIYYINEIKIEELIKNIKLKKNNSNEELQNEIIKLKNIIEYQKIQINNFKINNENIQCEDNKFKIAIIGEKYVGKTIIIKNIYNIFYEKKDEKCKYNFLEYNFDKYSYDCTINKFIFVIELNYSNIFSQIKKINNIIKKEKIEKRKINIIVNKIDKYSINKKIIKNIFKNMKIIGYINFDKYYDYEINKKNNYRIINKIMERKYLNIINKIIK